MKNNLKAYEAGALSAGPFVWFLFGRKQANE